MTFFKISYWTKLSLINYSVGFILVNLPFHFCYYPSTTIHPHKSSPSYLHSFLLSLLWMVDSRYLNSFTFTVCLSHTHTHAHMYSFHLTFADMQADTYPINTNSSNNCNKL